MCKTTGPVDRGVIKKSKHWNISGRPHWHINTGTYRACGPTFLTIDDGNNDQQVMTLDFSSPEALAEWACDLIAAARKARVFVDEQKLIKDTRLQLAR